MDNSRIARGLAFAAMALLSALLFAEETAGMTVTITGLESDKGKVMVAIYNSKDAYKANKDRFRQAVLPISGGKAETTLEGLPPGEYSVSVYHDENDNGKIDTNFIGIPKEAYGYSNNARGKKGPPLYEDTVVTLKEGVLKVDITVK